MNEYQLEARPLTFKIAGWYGMVFSACFLLYGGVSIILGFLDRDYSNMGNPILMLILGLVLISFAVAYKELKKWGWYGLVGINLVVVLLALIGYSSYIDIVLVILSAGALAALFSRTTREYLEMGS